MPRTRVAMALCFGIALSASASASAESAAQCARIRTELFNAMKPTLVLGAGKDLAEDQDADTLQIAIVEGYAASESHASDDGQVVYVAREVMQSEESAKQRTLLALLRQALERRIRLRYGDLCTG